MKMQLLINDEVADFRLEAERSVGDALSSLEDWGRKQNLLLTKAVVDDEEVLGEPDSKKVARERLLESVREMRVTFASRVEHASGLLLQLQNYLSRIAERLQSGDLSDEEAAVLTDNLPWLKEGFLATAKALDLGAESEGFWRQLKPFEIAAFELKDLLSSGSHGRSSKETFDHLNALAKNLLEETKPLLFKANTKILEQSFLAERHDWASFLKDAATHLDDLKQILVAASTALQVGKENLAMRYVGLVIETFSLFVSLLNRVERSAKDEAKAWAEGFNEHLRNIEEALKKKDFVYLGDVLEYEIVDAVDGLAKKMQEKNFLGSL